VLDFGGRKRRPLVDPAGWAAGPFRELRLALEHRATHGRGSTIVVTSPISRQGTSTLAANLALVAASDGLRVLVVDANLQSPRMHEFFGVPRDPGLVDLFESEQPASAYAHTVLLRHGHLQVLTAGSQAGTSHRLASPTVARLLDRARTGHDLIVIDAPSVLDGPDAAALATGHRGTYVVMTVRPRSRQKALRRSLRKLELVGADVAGLVVNDRAAFSFR
jgi:Mrp family chromosome partitioning ATPase